MIKVSDKEEFLDILNDDGTPTGKIEKRSIVHKNKLFHNEVALWIIDKENKRVLLQKRSPLKKQNPNKLALCAGHVVSGETIEEALKKEAKEEINIDITNYDVKKLTIIKRTEPQNHCFSHHFYILANIPISSLTAQKEELSEILYMNYSELKQLVIKNSDKVIFQWNPEYQRLFGILDNIIL